MRKSALAVFAVLALAVPAAGAPGPVPTPAGNRPAPALNPSTLVRAAVSGAPLTLDLGSEGRVTVRLRVSDVIGPHTRFTTTDAHGRFRPSRREPFTPMAGTVVGDATSVVRLTTIGGSISGYVFTGGRTITFDPDSAAHPRRTIVGRPSSKGAGAALTGDHVGVPRSPVPPVSADGVGNCWLIPCGTLTAGAILDGDSYFRAINASTCQSRQVAVFNAVDGIYSSPATRVHLIANQVNCRTAADLGTSSSDPNTYLNALRTSWSGVATDRSYVHLAVGFDFVGGIIGLAYQPGVCERVQPATVGPVTVAQSCDYGYGLYQAVSAGGGYTATSFLQAKLSAHETGHNFNAIHDDSSPDPIPCPSVSPRNGQIMCSVIQDAGPNTFSDKSAAAIRAWAEHTLGSITGT